MSNLSRIDVLLNFSTASEGIQLGCNCELIPIKTSLFSVMKGFIDSIREPLMKDGHSSIKGFVSKSLFSIKVFVKRPELLLPWRYSKKSYMLAIKGKPHNHCFVGTKIWVSENLWELRFQLPIDGHDHALSAVREMHYQGFAFRPKPKLKSKGEMNQKIHNQPYKPLNASMSDDYLIGQWKSSRFFQVLDGSTVLGLYTSKPGDSEFYAFYPSNQKPAPPMSSLLGIDKFQRDRHLDGTAVLVPFSRNFYHFVAEGMRSLIFCMQEQIDFDYIIVFSDTPPNFLKFINLLCPGKKIIIQEKLERVTCKSLVFCQVSSTFATTKDAFTDQSQLDFRSFDEFRILKHCRDFLSSDPNQSASCISISIRKKSQSRGFLNSSLLRLVLRGKRYSSLELSSVSLEEIRAKLSNSYSFVCESGAGIMNFLFLPENAQMIEVTYENGESWNPILRHFDVQYRRIRLGIWQNNIWGKWVDVYLYPIGRVIFALRKLSFEQRVQSTTQV